MKASLARLIGVGIVMALLWASYALNSGIVAAIQMSGGSSAYLRPLH